MKSSAFKYVGSLWGVLPLCGATAVALIWGAIFRPHVAPLWLYITGSLFSLMFAFVPVLAYLDAKRWEKEDAAREDALSAHR